MIEKNLKKKKKNVTSALNVLYAKKEKIYSAYISKHNSTKKKQWHYLAVKIYQHH